MFYVSGIEPLNYIVFCGLRTHSELNGKLVSTGSELKESCDYCELNWKEISMI